MHCLTSMSSWKPKFKLAGKVFTILQKWPDTDGEETTHSKLKENSLAGHHDRDYSDIPRTPTAPPTLNSAPTPRPDGPQSDTSSSSGIGTSSVNGSGDVHQRYELETLLFRVSNDDNRLLLSGSFFAGARDFILNGGEFYNIGGNLTIQQTCKQNKFQNLVPGNNIENCWGKQIPEKSWRWQLHVRYVIYIYINFNR